MRLFRGRPSLRLAARRSGSQPRARLAIERGQERPPAWKHYPCAGPHWGWEPLGRFEKRA